MLVSCQNMDLISFLPQKVKENFKDHSCLYKRNFVKINQRSKIHPSFYLQSSITFSKNPIEEKK